MKILLVAATPFEIAPTLQFLEENFTKSTTGGVFEKNGLEVWVKITGVGMTATAFALGQIFAQHPPNLAINAGIAGSFDEKIAIGSVVNVISERFGDLGVEEADGSFSDLFDLELLSPYSPPFIHGVLHNPDAAEFSMLPVAQGLSVQKVHGTPRSISKIRKKYPQVSIESMEGAAFFYACLSANIKFLEIRSISNKVEKRNRAAWNLPLAIDNLNEVLTTIITTLSGTPSAEN